MDEADNGAQAVEMAIRRFDRNAPYDAIIMDYSMPRMNGPTATMALRTMGYDGKASLILPSLLVITLPDEHYLMNGPTATMALRTMGYEGDTRSYSILMLPNK